VKALENTRKPNLYKFASRLSLSRGRVIDGKVVGRNSEYVTLWQIHGEILELNQRNC
jgi:hypothetical protein